VKRFYFAAQTLFFSEMLTTFFFCPEGNTGNNITSSAFSSDIFQTRILSGFVVG